MKIPRDLSGRALANALCRHWSYQIVHQVGSHIVLETEQPSHQRIAVPAHQYLRVGTLNAILRSVAEHKGVERQDILQFL
jgi:predicted RNA binding protein YcfA (HicA-like mRNA interferase family)